MKPTEEQILQWAREAGFHKYASDFPEMFEALATLAYEAGRKDENETLAKFIEDCDPSDHLAATIAAVIRARGEHG